MVLLDKVSLRRPLWEPGPGQKRVPAKDGYLAACRGQATKHDSRDIALASELARAMDNIRIQSV